MSTIAGKCGLSDEKYTNHCLRATGINILTPYFKRKEVHSISGHKSDKSLSIYEKVPPEKKIEIGMSLGHALLHVPQPKALLPAQVKALMPPATSTAPTPAVSPGLSAIQPTQAITAPPQLEICLWQYLMITLLTTMKIHHLHPPLKSQTPT